MIINEEIKLDGNVNKLTKKLMFLCMNTLEYEYFLIEICAYAIKPMMVIRKQGLFTKLRNEHNLSTSVLIIILKDAMDVSKNLVPITLVASA